MIRDRGHNGGNTWRWKTIEKFVKENGWTHGVELGVWEGATFRYLVQNCPNLHLIGVDLYAPQPENTGPEKWTPGENGHRWDHETYYNNLLRFCKQYPDRAGIIKDYTTSAATHFEEESLDFVFIDADHSYEGVKNDIEAWESKVKSGGYVIGHDIHFDSVNKAVTEKYGNTYRTADDFLWYVVKP